MRNWDYNSYRIEINKSLCQIMEFFAELKCFQLICETKATCLVDCYFCIEISWNSSVPQKSLIFWHFLPVTMWDWKKILKYQFALGQQFWPLFFFPFSFQYHSQWEDVCLAIKTIVFQCFFLLSFTSSCPLQDPWEADQWWSVIIESFEVSSNRNLCVREVWGILRQI